MEREKFSYKAKAKDLKGLIEALTEKVKGLKAANMSLRGEKLVSKAHFQSEQVLELVLEKAKLVEKLQQTEVALKETMNAVRSDKKFEELRQAVV